MKTEDSTCKDRTCILIEGPTYGDAEFYGNWLLSAAKANELLQQAKRDDPDFCKTMDVIECIRMLDIGVAATSFVSQFAASKQFDTFVIIAGRDDADADSNEHIDFVTMVEMGFFTLTGDRYQITLPTTLDLATIKKAHLKLAETEDEDWIHPERLFVDMPKSQAETYQRVLGKIGQAQRLADRKALLFLD